MDITDTLTIAQFAVLIGGLIYIGRKLQVLDDLQRTTDTIKANLKVVSDFLTRTNSEFDSSELKGYSPLSLTPEGKGLISKIGFDKTFSEHKEDFFACIDGEQPKLKYDVELAAIKSVSMLYDKDYMSALKVFFYNNPSRNLPNTAPTLGVYIRDKYLAEHPEISE